MGTYENSAMDIIDGFEDFLRNQEGDVSAKAIAGAWNLLAERWGWEDRLEATDGEDN